MLTTFVYSMIKPSNYVYKATFRQNQACQRFARGVGGHNWKTMTSTWIAAHSFGNSNSFSIRNKSAKYLSSCVGAVSF